MMDYHSIYVRHEPRELWNGGYFQAQKWLRIVPRDRAPRPDELTSTKLRAAITHTINTAAAP
jgi:hypothetical protein